MMHYDQYGLFDKARIKSKLRKGFSSIGIYVTAFFVPY